MKFLTVSMALLGGVLSSHGEEVAPHWDVEIPVPIANGTPSKSVPKPEPINFEVLSTRTAQMTVTEAPEMIDLPPIKGTINVTVQLVKDPGLPDPPPPLPALPPSDPAVLARLEELRKNYRVKEMVFLSATVYDHSRTLLRIYPNGNIAGEISAWSYIDFNYFSGFSTFRVKESDGTFRDYGLLMGIGNTDTRRLRERNAQLGLEFDAPKIPALPDLATSGPSFVVASGQEKGDAVDTLSQIHDLYRKEGVRMAEAFHAREKAYAERKAYLLANPSAPKDVAVQFWKRDKSGLSQQNKEGTSAR